MGEEIEEEIARALGRVDVPSARAIYRAQGEFLSLPRCLPLELVARLVEEVERVRPFEHRVRVPGKKSASVSFYALRRHAPAIMALYRSPALARFLAALTEGPVLPCPEDDPHACALYVYRLPGDYITAHYDTSFYRGVRYTVLVGLVNRTQSRLACRLHRDDPSRAPVDLALATEPGTAVVFNGDTLWHAVTPLGAGEERVTLTMQFVTTQAMSRFKRFVSDMKDSISYFGFREVFGGRAHERREG
ncbi:MAG TPA: 2OG-Fe(II) oxygenase [Candidatus Binatia bacterium]|nr:2OG-Fe(II) oxygenase [Candidatus Binatia bacterium]